MGYVDMHSHVLPKVDDGAENMSMALELIDMAYKEGIRVMCATPHYYRRSRPVEHLKKEVASYEALKAQIQDKYTDFSLYLGQEIFYETGIEEDLEKGWLRSYNGSDYFLLEFDPMETFTTITRGCMNFMRRGCIPVIAHCERLEALRGHRERIQELKQQGVLLQMNTRSLEGSLLNRRVVYCRGLVKKGYIDVLGTDTHNPTCRPPKYRSAVQWINQHCGRERCKELTQQMPQKILMDN